MQFSTIITSAFLSVLAVSAAPASPKDASNILTQRSCPAPKGTAVSVDVDTQYKVGDIWTSHGVCQTMGAGSYTFSMIVGISTLGLPDSTQQSNSFLIFDNTCKIVGIWGPSNCGTPWTISADFLKYELIIKDVAMTLGDAGYDFAYAAGEYKIGANGCTCVDLGASFPSAAQGCGCAFPVNGEPEN